jgi:hypothetical protein
MQKPELEFHQPAGPWKRVDGDLSRGIWEQLLAHDPSTDELTSIQRYDPGAATNGSLIHHDYWEEIFILSGGITDLTLKATFTAGMYACRPPGMPHGPYRSNDGCQILVFKHS